MPLRLAYLSVTTTFALCRLLPMTNRAKDTECDSHRSRSASGAGLRTPNKVGGW